MRDRIRVAARLAGLGLFVAAVVLIVAFAVPSAIGAEESFVVLSGSMSPELAPGDVVVVRDRPPEDIEVGDVITYRAEDQGVDRVTHRVVDRQRTDDGVVFRTKGDANDLPDAEPVSADQIVGTVWFHLPAVGRAILFVQRPLGALLCILLPGLYLIGSGVRTLYGALNGERRGASAES